MYTGIAEKYSFDAENMKGSELLVPIEGRQVKARKENGSIMPEWDRKRRGRLESLPIGLAMRFVVIV